MPDPIPKGVRTRVQKGIDFLDEYGPEDWRNGIDLGTLNLSSPTDCVLGQLYGVYSLVESDDGTLFDMDPFPYEDLGFEVEGEPYAVLTQAWHEALVAEGVPG